MTLEIGARLLVFLLVLLGVVTYLYILTIRQRNRSVQPVSRPAPRPASPPTSSPVVDPFMIIVGIVAARFDVGIDEILGDGRSAALVPARQVAMRLVKEELGLSYSATGRLFNRVHSTVLHACKATDGMMLGDIRQEIAEALRQ